jgi:hypothetical protein
MTGDQVSNRTQDLPGFHSPAEQEQLFLLSPQQEQLFLLPGAAAVTQAVVLVADQVSESDLRSALDRVVSRHEILRTTFTALPGMRVPAQLIRAELPVAWSPEAALDTEQGPILRAVLTTLPDSGRALVLTAPAACLDASSMILLLRELGRGTDEVDDPLQYPDYVEWRRQLAADDGPEAEAARAWWGQEPAQRATQLLFGRAGEGGVEPRRLRFTLGDEEVAAVRAAAESRLVSEAVLLEACVHALVSRLSGDGELVLAGLADGRSQPDLAGALGPYAQLVPVRTRIEAGTTFAELLDQVRRARLDATRWQDYATSQQLALAARATIGFAHYELALEGELWSRAGLQKLATRTGPLALEFVVYSQGSSLTCELAYDPSWYDAADIDRIAACFSALVLSVAGDPAQLVAALALLGDAERAAGSRACRRRYGEASKLPRALCVRGARGRRTAGPRGGGRNGAVDLR